MQEFVYYNPNKLEFPLAEEIKVSSNKDELSDGIFLISNNDEIEAEVYTKDVDF